MHDLHLTLWFLGWCTAGVTVLAVLFLFLVTLGIRREEFLVREASLIMPAVGDPSEDPLRSWFGSVRVATPEEYWPTYEGIPMLPLCQLRCDEMPHRPTALDNIAMLCIFVAYAGDEVVSPQGERWVLRTYADLENLVPITYPGDPSLIRSYPIAYMPVRDSPQDLSQIPRKSWMDIVNQWGPGWHHDHVGKVGGYGWNRNGKKPSLDELQADFAFQLYLEGSYPCLRGSGGTLAFARSRSGSADSWFLCCDPPPLSTDTSGSAVRLGCEVEGMQLSLLSREALSISYQGRAGRVYHMSDLQGLVHITTPAMALRFVRLQTCGLLKRYGEVEHEIGLEAEDLALPEWYSITLPDGSRANRTGGWELYSRGCSPPESEPAQVEIMEDGFRIVRWTCSHSKDGNPDLAFSQWVGSLPQVSYQQIAETVKTDGAYTRMVMHATTVPPNGSLRSPSDLGETD